MNSISGVAKSMLQMRAGMKTEDVSKDMEERMTVSFMELMNQNSFSANVQVSSNFEDIDVSSASSGDARTAYDSTVSAKKELSVKKEVTAAEKKDEASEQLEAYEEEVREVLKNELGVTDEEIDQAMDALGLEFFDLVNTKNLTALVQTLTGEDIGTLFLSDAFQNIMSEVSALTDALSAELGMTKDELLVLCDEWKQMSAADEKNNSAEPIVVEEDIPAEENVADTEDGQNISTEKNAAAGTMGQQTEGIEETAENRKVTLTGTEEAEAKDVEVTTAETESFSQESKHSFSGNTQNADSDAGNSGMLFTNQQMVQNEEFVVPQENIQPYTQVDAADLIDQVAKNIRVHISADITSMEMQLNPEHLGKLYLQVSESEGMIRAQITTQTEIAKEALETQLVELRQTLHQQGVKVDAIEVTVAAHEFEQNLENNAKQEEQMQQQMEETQKQARRNLNRNDLDGLSGLMSEEEALVAKIMKDNGNQVDLTA